MINLLDLTVEQAIVVQDFLYYAKEEIIKRINMYKSITETCPSEYKEMWQGEAERLQKQYDLIYKKEENNGNN